MEEESELKLEELVKKFKGILIDSWIYRYTPKEGKRSSHEEYLCTQDQVDYRVQELINPTSVLPRYVIMARISNPPDKADDYFVLFASDKENYNSFQMMEGLFKYLQERKVKRIKEKIRKNGKI